MESRIAFTQTTKRFNCPVKREFISLYDMNSLSLMSHEELIENIWKSEFDGLTRKVPGMTTQRFDRLCT